MSQHLPLQVYGRHRDPDGIARLIAGSLEGAVLHDGETVISVTVTAKRRFRRVHGRDVTVNVSRDHFDGESGARQKAGLSTYLVDNMHGAGMTRVLETIPDLAVAVTFVTATPITATADDPLFRLALGVAAVCDGFVMSVGDGAVWSPAGDVLVSAGPPDDITVEFDEFEPDPPSVGRVRARLFALTAVAARALAEAAGDHLDEARAGTLAWVDALGLDAELEPHERAVLDAPAGMLPDRDRVDGSWRVEGAVVLAWALGLLELPSHDETADPATVFAALGFPDAGRTNQVAAATALRPPVEIDQLASRMLAVHWRFREFGLRPSDMDFTAFAQTAWFGPLEITDVALVDGDLAVGGRAISDADPERVRTGQSIALERHRAANWLRDGGLYSETDTST